MSGDKEEARAKGGNTMVVTLGFGFGRDADGGPRGRVDGGGGGDGWDRNCDRRLVKWGG